MQPRPAPVDEKTAKTTYHLMTVISPATFEAMDAGYEAILEGKSTKNLDVIFPQLEKLFRDPLLYRDERECKQDFDGCAYSSREKTLAIGFLLSPTQVEENGYGTARLKDKEVMETITRDDIVYCYPGSDAASTYREILTANTAKDLKNKLRQLFIPIPPRIPHTVAMIANDINNERMSNMSDDKSTEQDNEINNERVPNISDDKSTEQDNVVALEIIFEKLAKRFGLIKKAMQDYLAANVLHEFHKDSFLQFIQHIEGIEKVLQNRIAHIPATAGKLNFKSEAFVVPQIRMMPKKPVDAKLMPMKACKKYLASGLIEDCKAILRVFPKSHGVLLTAEDNLMKGDLHGNFLSLLYFLILENVIKGIDKNDYDELFRIYGIPTNKLKKADIDQFESIIKKIKAVHSLSPLITFVGGMLANTGSNDYFTLRILQQLKAEKIPFEVLISKHDREFIGAWERGEIHVAETVGFYEYTSDLRDWQAASLFNMGILFKANLIDRNIVIAIIEEIYLPTLKLVDLGIDEQHKTLYFAKHAPVAPVKKMIETAKQFSLPIEEEKMQLVQSIENCHRLVNGKLTELVSQGKLFKSSYTRSPLWDWMYEGRVDYSDPREQDILPKGWRAVYIHGHDDHGYSSKFRDHTRRTVINLGSEFGQSLFHMEVEGRYTCFYAGTNENFLKLRQAAISAQANQLQSSSTAAIVRLGIPVGHFNVDDKNEEPALKKLKTAQGVPVPVAAPASAPTARFSHS